MWSVSRFHFDFWKFSTSVSLCSFCRVGPPAEPPLFREPFEEQGEFQVHCMVSSTQRNTVLMFAGERPVTPVSRIKTIQFFFFFGGGPNLAHPDQGWQTLHYLISWKIALQAHPYVWVALRIDLSWKRAPKETIKCEPFVTQNLVCGESQRLPESVNCDMTKTRNRWAMTVATEP